MEEKTGLQNVKTLAHQHQIRNACKSFDIKIISCILPQPVNVMLLLYCRAIKRSIGLYFFYL